MPVLPVQTTLHDTRTGQTSTVTIFEDTPAPPTAEAILSAERQTMSMSFAQLLIGLVAEGWITSEQGENWLAGAPPAPVLAAIALLDPQLRFAALARATRPSVVFRTNSLVEMLALAQSKTPNQIDQFFRDYSKV